MSGRDYSHTLINLSNYLQYLGCREDALEAIVEVVDLCHHLANEPPAALDTDFTLALDRLSNHLSDIGHREEALKASLQVVDLYWPLAED